jgi:hypothetical protein
MLLKRRNWAASCSATVAGIAIYGRSKNAGAETEEIDIFRYDLEDESIPIGRWSKRRLKGAVVNFPEKNIDHGPFLLYSLRNRQVNVNTP